MKTHLFGYHHIVFPDGRREDMVVVEVDEQGRYVSHRPLQTGTNGTDASFIEEPFVQWLGGTFRLT